MPNRGWSTHNKEGRRVRIWLRAETWAALEEKAKERYQADGLNGAIEDALELWRVSQLDWANRRAIATLMGQLAERMEKVV